MQQFLRGHCATRRSPSLSVPALVSTSTLIPATQSTGGDMVHVTSQRRHILIPKQLSAFGGRFANGGGNERSRMIVGTPVLQDLPSIARRGRTVRRTTMIDAFEDMGLEKSVRDAMRTELAITEPSPIQQLTISTGTARKEALVVASPSGSGKTLACLAPAYSNMVRDRDILKIPTREFRPRMIVVAPTRELLRQWQNVCSKLDAHTGMRSIVMSRTVNMKRKLKKMLREGPPVDVVVMHPQMLLRLIRLRRLFLDDLRYVIADEVDELLSVGQDFDLPHLIAKIQRRNMFDHLPAVNTQYYFATACMTRRVGTFLTSRFPQAEHCWAPQVHKAPENIKFRFMPVVAEQHKMELLEHLLNRECRNYPLLTPKTEHDEAALQALAKRNEGPPLRRADVLLRASSSEGVRMSEGDDDADPTSAGASAAPTAKVAAEDIDEEEENITAQEWRSRRRAETAALRAAIKDTSTPNGSNDASSTKAITTTASSTSNEKNAITTKSGLHDQDVVTSSPDAFVLAPESAAKMPQGSGASRWERAARERLRSSVSKALAIPTSRKYATAGLVRPAVRWQNLLTHASPFTFHIPQTVVAQSGLRTIIFTRGIDCCAAVYFTLRNKGYNVTLLHASLPEDVRKHMLHRFASGASNILVCTDLMARGVDIPVDVVINFNIPRDAVNLLMRAGRCGRMGRPGTCYSLYHKKKEAVITNALSVLIHRGLTLNDISNDKNHVGRARYREWSLKHKNALAKAYIGLITQKALPKALEKTYIRHNAMWRPLYHPNTTLTNAGVAPRQQDKLMNRVMNDAVNFRREQLAKRKGGSAKFGRRAKSNSPWSFKDGVSAGPSVSGGGEDQYVPYGVPQKP